MPCKTYLSEFIAQGKKPIKWGAYPMLIDTIDFETNTINREAYTPYRQYDPCSNPICISFLNKYGGYDQWVFEGNHDYVKDIPQSVSYINTENEEIPFFRENTRNGFLIRTNILSKEDGEVLKELLSCIDVFWHVAGFDDTNPPNRVLLKQGLTFPYWKDQNQVQDIEITLFHSKFDNF